MISLLFNFLPPISQNNSLLHARLLVACIITALSHRFPAERSRRERDGHDYTFVLLTISFNIMWGKFQHEVMVLVGGRSSNISQRYVNRIMLLPCDDVIALDQNARCAPESFSVEAQAGNTNRHVGCLTYVDSKGQHLTIILMIVASILVMACCVIRKEKRNSYTPNVELETIGISIQQIALGMFYLDINHYTTLVRPKQHKHILRVYIEFNEDIAIGDHNAIPKHAANDLHFYHPCMEHKFITFVVGLLTFAGSYNHIWHDCSKT
ncbi:hypothetical protein CAPTEDRAFT_197141 [Capitella teleta]|uniref:Uncharacterized protein n=1 Tax=Capitella teleta TaxID=283909 RepID=R7U0H0_CAPTE|nr:hypothetical protein CAPTEDRAFT_197141 [Capitella teleta]|eukprot:ELT99322.1 hypothetical protein CAPTEDRAFT_197141 [Capitella teleta]